MTLAVLGNAEIGGSICYEDECEGTQEECLLPKFEDCAWTYDRD